MKSYRMLVRRKIIEEMRFVIPASSAKEAHEMAEQEVLTDMHPGQNREDIATVLECHEIVDDKQETGRQIDRQSEREDGAG